MVKPSCFKPGDRVMVVSVPPQYDDKLQPGAVGAVLSSRPRRRHEEVRVVFEEYHNGRSRYDAFHFWEDSLVRVEFDSPETERIVSLYTQMFEPRQELHLDESFEFKIDPDPMFENKKEETPMNTMYNEKNCRVAGVTLDPYNSKEYAYALFLDNVEPGAKVVVRNSNGSLVMGRLASVDNHPHEKVKNGCEVICVIDMTEYNKRQEQFAKVAELRKKMDARVKALQDIALYEMLAKDDPELKDLLAEFKTVSQ